MADVKNKADEIRKSDADKDKRLAEYERAYLRLSSGNKSLLFSESNKDQCCNERYRGFER